MGSPSSKDRLLAGFAGRAALLAVMGGALAACQDTGATSNARAYRPIPSDVLALMTEKGTDAHKPVLIRAYKKEAELEIWKMKADGQYALLKTYPMCRWSGQLGPKIREGDRQVPEGFYTITPGQMNPNSAYYLSFNVGYPNAYDRAHGYTGGSIMVHGACSSAGCFSMTDEQIAEIYAITREAFGGGQRAIQMQSLPFRMTAENLAKHRFDPNIKFWKELKEGTDQFDVTKQETKVGVCARRYVFGQTPADGRPLRDGADVCPPLQEDTQLKALVAEKQKRDEAKVAELIASGVKPVKIVYADGGQHPDFAEKVTELSRPEALDLGPKEIVIDEKGRPVPAAVQVAAAKPVAKGAAPAGKPEVASAAPAGKIVAAPASAPAAVAAAAPASGSSESQPFYRKLLGFTGLSGAEAAPAPASAPDTAAAPLPPKRQATSPAKSKPEATLAPAAGSSGKS